MVHIVTHKVPPDTPDTRVRCARNKINILCKNNPLARAQSSRSIAPTHLLFIPGLLQALLEHAHDRLCEARRALDADQNRQQVCELVRLQILRHRAALELRKINVREKAVDVRKGEMRAEGLFQREAAEKKTG